MAIKKGKTKVLVNRPGVLVTMTEYEAEPKTIDYGIPKQAWRRGLKLMKKYGAEEACYKIDERAWRCFRRGDDRSAIRWRDLIVAIHAIDRGEKLPGEIAH